MSWKLFNTPDVNPKTNPKEPYHYQQYDKKHEHDVDSLKK